MRSNDIGRERSTIHRARFGDKQIMGSVLNICDLERIMKFEYI